MTPQEISQIYEELERLEIKLEQAAVLGTEYLTDKLLECRQKQNTVTDIIVKTNRAYSGARMAVRAQEAAVRVAGMSARGAELRDELSKMLDERDSLKYLLEALSVRRANLGRTSSDIRLMANIIEAERAPGRANAGQERPRPAPPPVVPTAMPTLDQPRIPTTEEFAGAVADLASKIAETTPEAPPAAAAPLPAEMPMVEPQEILAPETVTAAPAAEPKTKKEPKPPAAPTLAADEEIDMDAFLES